MHVHELHDLAFGNDIGGLGHHVQDAQIVTLDHHLEGSGIQEIANQHAGWVAKHGVGGGASAAQIGVVHHVVVKQGGGVNELDDGGQFVVIAAFIAQSACHEQQQNGSQTLSASQDDVLGDLPDKRNA